MNKTSIFEEGSLLYNVVRNFSIVGLLTLVGITFWWALKEAYLQNAFNKFQGCLNWLRLKQKTQKRKSIQYSSNDQYSSDQACSEQQLNLNQIFDEKKIEFIMQADSNISQQKPQFLAKQNSGLNQYELKKQPQKLNSNKEFLQNKKTDKSNKKQQYQKNSKVFQKSIETNHLITPNQKNQKEYRSESQTNVGKAVNIKNFDNPENFKKQQDLLQSSALLNIKDKQVKNLQGKLAQYQKQNKYLKNSLQSSQIKSTFSVERENSLRKQISQLQKIKKQLFSQKQELEKQIKELKTNQKFRVIQIEKLKKQLSSKEFEILTLAQRNRVAEDQNRTLQDSRSGFEKNRQALNKQLETNNCLKQERNNLFLSLKAEKQLVRKKQLEYEQLWKVKSYLEEGLKEHQEQTQQLINNFKNRQQQLLKSINDKKQQIQSVKKRLLDQIDTQKEKIRQYSLMQAEIKNLKLQLEVVDPLIHLFTGDLIDQQLQHKLFIIQSIENYTKKAILKTKKLYTSEKLLNFSFHKYIDQVPDVVVIVKTVAGIFLAGYSQCPVSSNTTADKGGLILALNKKKVFKLIRGKRSVTYDSYFLIVGNSEIRLKNQQWKVFSNFGIANSFFESNGCGVNDLLGEGPGTRQVSIVNFEVYQVLFK